jgi:hypothetical protein
MKITGSKHANHTDRDRFVKEKTKAAGANWRD